MFAPDESVLVVAGRSSVATVVLPSVAADKVSFFSEESGIIDAAASAKSFATSPLPLVSGREVSWSILSVSVGFT